jgi:hypothetical protein
MLLTPDDAALFFKLMPALQTYANRTLKLVENLVEPLDYRKVSMDDRVKLRDALYQKHRDLISEFARENPYGFAADELAIVAGWQNCLPGDFYFVDVTKRYNNILIHDKSVYAVLALTDPLHYIINQPLPTLIKTVLLPFKGKIIYDGLLQGYNVSFGPGIRSSIQSQYKIAKSKGQIIESLDPDWKPVPPKNLKDWRPLLEELSEKASKLRSGADEPPMHSPAFSLVKASLELARTAVESPEDADKLGDALDKVMRAANKAEKQLYNLY